MLSFATWNGQVQLIVSFSLVKEKTNQQFSGSCWKFHWQIWNIAGVFSAFVVKGGNVAVLCQKTPTRPMCSCSLLLYISTRARMCAHTQLEREKYFVILYVELMLSREISGWKLMLQKTHNTHHTYHCACKDRCHILKEWIHPSLFFVFLIWADAAAQHDELR